MIDIEIDTDIDYRLQTYAEGRRGGESTGVAAETITASVIE